jgi:DNA polymerase-3 subunit gamma/tau
MINGEKSDVIEIDAASNSGVENVRGIIEDSKKRSIISTYKVFIIDECHSLSNEAWQAMLKLLEEPPKYSIFILCTTDPQKIPATIMSRVQRYQFNKISVDGIKKRLLHILEAEFPTGDYQYDIDAISYIAKLSNGGMRDAITLMDKCLSLGNNLTLEDVLNVVGTASSDTFFDLLKKLNDKDKSCTDFLDEAFNAGKDIKIFMKEFSKFVLDVEKFCINPKFEYITIPSTYESTLGYFSDVTDVLELVFNINNNIKWDSDPKTLAEMMMILFCGDER